MKRGLYFFIFAMILMLRSSCIYQDSVDKTLFIYKSKKDYFNHVCVKLSSDKTRITSNYGPRVIDSKWPVRMVEGYLLGGSFGVNSAYLSITNDEYNQNYEVAPSPDSLYKLIIDADPFLEFYQSETAASDFATDQGLDTARINEIIKNDQLELYFYRLK